MNIIHIDRPILSGAEVNQYKDFKALMDHFSGIPAKIPMKKGWYKFGIPFISVAFLSLFVWLVIIPLADNKDQQVEEFRFINPPLPGADIPYIVILIEELHDTVIHIPPATTIELKRNGLADSAGNLVNGPVEIRFRQIMNPAEIFLSGIPMTYDSAGIRSTFESAGMIEIAAFCRNKPLCIVPEKPIKISYRSTLTGSDYNLYYLDTLQRNWIYMGEDGIDLPDELTYQEQTERDRVADPLTDSLIEIRSAIAGLVLQKPDPPVLANPKKWHFRLDVLATEFPELSVYAKTVFEIDERYKVLNPSHPAIQWENVVIERSDKPLYYYVTFTKDTITVRYLACPVLTGESYKVAMQKYESRYTDYQRELAKRKEREEQSVQQLIFRQAMRFRDSIAMEKYIASRQTENSIIRSFTIMRFGIWNYDKPLKYNQMQSIEPVMKVNDTVYSKTCYLADLTRNALITVNPGNDLVFEKESKKILWMVTGKDKVAVFTDEDFSRIPDGAKSYTFDLKPINTPLNSSEDFLRLFHADFKETP